MLETQAACVERLGSGAATECADVFKLAARSAAGRLPSQRRAPMLVQDGWTVVLASWIAHGKACGIIFRESRDTIVRENSRVLPHLFR